MEYTINKYYTKNLSLYTDFRALGWESEESQYKRFEVLIKNVEIKNKSLLDVGCGLGDLYGLLSALKLPVNYLGIDILPDMITKAKHKYPKGLFIYEDIFSKQMSTNIFPEKSFDVVFSSGIFNLKTTNSASLLREALLTFKELAKETIVFNLLSTESKNKEDEYCYYSQQQVDNLLRTLRFDKTNFRFIHGYLPNDFTVIIDNQ